MTTCPGFDWPAFVHVLLLRDAPSLPVVAVCLDFDIVTQAPTHREAEERFGRAWLVHILDDKLDGQMPLARLPRAPDRYWALAEKIRVWVRSDIVLSAPPFDIPRLAPPMLLLGFV